MMLNSITRILNCCRAAPNSSLNPSRPGFGPALKRLG